MRVQKAAQKYKKLSVPAKFFFEKVHFFHFLHENEPLLHFF